MPREPQEQCLIRLWQDERKSLPKDDEAVYGDYIIHKAADDDTKKAVELIQEQRKIVLESLLGSPGIAKVKVFKLITFYHEEFALTGFLIATNKL